VRASSLVARNRVRRVVGGLAGIVLLVASAAHADKVTLRIATIAPDGTEWARLARNFSREVEHETNGEVVMRWYFGAVAGGEVEMINRIRRGQLDGAASGGMMCQRLAPSMRVMRVVGLFQSRDEALHVVNKLRPRLDEEFAHAGFANLGETGFGSDIIFSRKPIRSLDDLRHGKFWVWDLDDVWAGELPQMGIHPMALPVEAAASAYEDGRTDGFLAITTAALAYQWSSRARYFTSLPMAYLMGCLVVTQSSFDILPTAHQEAIRAAAAKLMIAVENMGRRQEAALWGGLFERQGMKHVPIPDSFRSDFLDTAAETRERIGGNLLPRALLNEVSGWLADWRADRRRASEPGEGPGPPR
jgi:TRAP-type C4-dicarboxylate transport system substrate-binding protein